MSLSSFVGLGKEHLEQYFKKTNKAIYLHIKREKHEVIFKTNFICYIYNS